MLISQGNLTRNSLKDTVAVVTGAGRGIGYEVARGLIWLGAKVVIAEVDEKNGVASAENLNIEFCAEKALFVKTDVGNEKEVKALAEQVVAKLGKVDIVVNNAAVFPVGAVKDTAVDAWDLSYRVNLRGPVLLARVFLPEMIKRKYGVFTCVSSSGTVPFMGAYETLKTAQVKLINTIAAEVEDTGVYVFTIEPGAVMSPGFLESNRLVRTLTGLTLKQLLAINNQVEISTEAAGVGVAGAVALASRYHGQETSSLQVLQAMGIQIGGERENLKTKGVDTKAVYSVFQSVLKTYIKQSEVGKSCNLFRRQWLAREFKRNTGLSIDEMYNTLITLGKCLEMKTSVTEFVEPLKKLGGYYGYQQELLRGLAKFSKKASEDLHIIEGWICEVNALLKMIGG